MIFYILVFLFVLYFLCSTLPQSHARKIYGVVAAVFLIFISGMRHPSVGEHSDTEVYLGLLDSTRRLSWSTIINNFFPMYINPVYQGEISKDPGFSVFVKIVGTIVYDHHIYLLLIAVLCIAPLSNFIYKHTRDLFSEFWGFVYYVYFFFSYIPNSSIRQSLALSILLFCYELLRKDKYKKCIFFLFLASTLHKSVLVFLIFMFFHRMKLNKTVFTYALVPFLILLSTYQVFSLLFLYMGDVYSAYSESQYFDKNEPSYSFVVFSFLIYLLTLIPVLRKSEKKFEDNKIAYMASSFAFFLTPLMLIDPAILRIIVFFAVWNFILIPHSIKMYYTPVQRLIVIGLCAIFLYTSFKVDNDYKFYWQVKIYKSAY